MGIISKLTNLKVSLKFTLYQPLLS